MGRAGQGWEATPSRTEHPDTAPSGALSRLLTEQAEDRSVLVLGLSLVVDQILASRDQIRPQV